MAWLPLGWQCAFTAEIEPFPCAVLQHHYPETPNHGDITKFKEWPITPIDVLIGGTPCQAFSVAGLRGGLADPRGNLTLTFLSIVERYRPGWLVWENVPGVLSIDGGRVFGAFLGGLGQLGYGFAWRVLDAQHFGVAQRRRRVFVVGCAGGQWQRAAAVLFERESLCGHPPPRRPEGQGTAPSLAKSLGAGCGGGIDREDKHTVIPIQEIGKRQSGNPMNGVGHGQDGDPMFTLQANAQHGICEISPTLRAGGNQTGGHRPPGTDVDTCETLIPEIIPQAMSSKWSKGISGPAGDECANMIPVAFTQNQAGDVLTGDVSAAMGTNCNATGRNTPKVQTAMAVRRLTPKECCRLQGFPDDYLDIDFRGKPATDGHKYKALGNSMAVPVIQWIGERIQKVSEL